MDTTKVTRQDLHSVVLANREGTIHKFLIHGAGIVKHDILPIGQRSEGALEARQKEIRRLLHIRKTYQKSFLDSEYT